MHACACVCAYSKIFLLRVLLVFSTGAGRAMSSPAFMIDSKLFSLSPANVTTSPCPSPTTFTCTHAHTHTYTHHQTSQTPSTNVTEYRNIGHNVCGVVRVNIWKDQFTSKMYWRSLWLKQLGHIHTSAMVDATTEEINIWMLTYMKVQKNIKQSPCCAWSSCRHSQIYTTFTCTQIHTCMHTHRSHH